MGQDGPVLTVTVAHADLLTGLEARGIPTGARVVLWDLVDPAPVPVEEIDVVVVPNYFVRREGYRALEGLPRLRVVQLPSAGIEHALPHLPAGLTVCNGRGVHDAGTAELALALTLASQRGLDEAIGAMPEGRWQPTYRSSLADRRVLVVGAGAIGSAVARRVEAFEAEVVRVGRSARRTSEGQVHAIDEVPALLPTVDVVILVVPLTEETHHLVDAAFLAALPDGALVVNVARGKVIDTQALLAELESGRLRAALDVTDPEPLPADHPLWRAPRTIITPHEGGYTDATTPRLVDLVGRQVDALVAGEEPVNVVART
ncbi:2-hydroxyacid dehydrogenase [Actinotalea sp. BY-33]|uniref:2-hydroxyacid dehydrogenase n=1 Tax=Actinotalea soli TaxID=2819234 RepID=A0A939LQM0_9CELL|nr:2-hydroxyacid dehydrogenase [Actinotalea soli]